VAGSGPRDELLVGAGELPEKAITGRVVAADGVGGAVASGLGSRWHGSEHGSRRTSAT
jgi:hypothetical protein